MQYPTKLSYVGHQLWREKLLSFVGESTFIYTLQECLYFGNYPIETILIYPHCILRGWEFNTSFFCADLHISCNSKQKVSWYLTSPLEQGLKHDFLCTSGNFN